MSPLWFFFPLLIPTCFLVLIVLHFAFLSLQHTTQISVPPPRFFSSFPFFSSFCPFHPLCTFISHVFFSFIPLQHSTQTSMPPAEFFLYSLVLCASSVLVSVSSLSCIYAFCLHLRHTTQIFVSPAGFEPAIPAGEWPQTHVPDCAVNGIGVRVKTAYLCGLSCFGWYFNVTESFMSVLQRQCPPLGCWQLISQQIFNNSEAVKTSRWRE